MLMLRIYQKPSGKMVLQLQQPFHLFFLPTKSCCKDIERALAGMTRYFPLMTTNWCQDIHLWSDLWNSHHFSVVLLQFVLSSAFQHQKQDFLEVADDRVFSVTNVASLGLPFISVIISSFSKWS
jgi:hypothetical protein